MKTSNAFNEHMLSMLQRGKTVCNLNCYYVQTRSHVSVPWVDGIYEELLRAAVYNCASHSADVLYPIDSIKQVLNDLSTYKIDRHYKSLIGFHNNGVDSPTIMEIKYNDQQTYGNFDEIYKAIYCFEINIENSEYTSYREYRGEMEIRLVKIK